MQRGGQMAAKGALPVVAANSEHKQGSIEQMYDQDWTLKEANECVDPCCDRDWEELWYYPGGAVLAGQVEEQAVVEVQTPLATKQDAGHGWHDSGHFRQEKELNSSIRHLIVLAEFLCDLPW